VSSCTYQVSILVVVLVTDISPQTEEALFMVFLAVIKELVITIETLPAKATLRMALESRWFGRVLVVLSSIASLEVFHEL